MSRTPLLGRLLDAARAADDPTPPSLSRRELLGGVLAAGALAACERAERVVAPPLTAKTNGGTASVAIVGGGLAGLTCAYRLRQAGIAATVYEATGRLGGRCWTRRGDFADGQFAEHGGELIDQSHTTIRQLAQELGLPLQNLLREEARGTEPLFWIDGAPYRHAEATRDVKAVWQKLQRDRQDAGYPTTYAASTPRGRQLDAMSVRDWIAESVPGGTSSRLGQLLDVAYEIEYGASCADQSALNLIYLMGFSGQGQLRLFGPSNEKYRVRGGNDQLVSRLADVVGDRVVSNAALQAIARRGDGRYELSFGGGVPGAVVDRVVLALPFSVVRASVDVEGAGFDTRKRQAIAQLGMGQNAKLNVQFTSRHWETLGCGGDTFADTGYQATWDVTRGQPGAAGILVDYTGGATAVAQSGAAGALAQTFLQRLEPVLPGASSRWNGRATIDHWPSNPWTLGSYSYYRVGQYTAFGGAEREVSGACHFAGEHTSQDAQGYLEGAVESGARAAAEILAAVGVERG